MKNGERNDRGKGGEGSGREEGGRKRMMKNEDRGIKGKGAVYREGTEEEEGDHNTCTHTHLHCSQFHGIVQSTVKLAGINPGEQFCLVHWLLTHLLLRTVTVV